MCYSPNHQFLLTSTLDSTHRLFPRYHPGGEFTASSCVKTYQGHVHEKFSVASAFVSLSGELDCVMSGSENGRLLLWDVQTATILHNLEAHKGKLHRLI